MASVERLLKEIAADTSSRLALLSLLGPRETVEFMVTELPYPLQNLRKLLKRLGFKVRKSAYIVTVEAPPEAKEKLADLLAKIYRFEEGKIWAGVQVIRPFEEERLAQAKPLLRRIGLSSAYIIKSLMRWRNFDPDELKSAGFEETVGDGVVEYRRTDSDGFAVIVKGLPGRVNAYVEKNVEVPGGEVPLRASFTAYPDAKKGELNIDAAKVEAKVAEKFLKETVEQIMGEAKRRGFAVEFYPPRAKLLRGYSIRVEAKRGGETVAVGYIEVEGAKVKEPSLNDLFPMATGILPLSRAVGLAYKLLAGQKILVSELSDAEVKVLEEEIGLKVRGKTYLAIGNKDFPKVFKSVLRWMEKVWKEDPLSRKQPFRKALKHFSVVDALKDRGIYRKEIYEELRKIDEWTAAVYKAATAPSLEKALEPFDELVKKGYGPRKLAKFLESIGNRFLLEPEDNAFWEAEAKLLKIHGERAADELSRRVPVYGKALEAYANLLSEKCGLGKPHKVGVDWQAEWRYRDVAIVVEPPPWHWHLKAVEEKTEQAYPIMSLEALDELEKLSWDLIEEAYEEARQTGVFVNFTEKIGEALRAKADKREKIEIAS